MTGKTYDMVVVGGGLSGLACAVKSARNGKKVLLVERRPALGWESTWAGQLDFSGKGKTVARGVIKTLARVGGFRRNRADAPILEMVLDRLAAQAGVEVLLYSYPVRLVVDGPTAFGVVIGNKSGEQVIKARVIVDATEEALLWKQTDPFRHQASLRKVGARQVFFFNHCEGKIRLPLAMGGGITLYPSIWKNEVLAEFDLERNDVLAARRMMPDVIKRIRAEVPQLRKALVSHAAVEPFPAGPLVHFDNSSPRHPLVKNLFAAGIWASEPGNNNPVGRLNLGEMAGELASRCEGAKKIPGELTVGSILTPPVEAATDVLVVGGGTGGAIAGIVAGREGADTMLIEASPVLGGIGTGGAIHWYCCGLPGGIQDEVDERVKKLTPLFTGKWKSGGYHPEVKKIVLQQMLEEAGVKIKLNTVVSGVICRNAAPGKGRPGKALKIRETADQRKCLAGVIAVAPGGVTVCNARTFIDSTGDGDVAVMAGAPFQAGRERDNIMHSFSQPCGNLAGDGSLSFMNFDAGYVDPTDVVDLTRGRRLGINIFFWSDGFNEKNRLLYLAPLIGLRQSRQIIGEYQLTLADGVAGRRFEDVISYTSAFYDNHGFDYENESDESVLWVWALGNWNKYFGTEVPYRSLIPKKVDGLLLACRALSMTYDAHMQFRMQKDIQRVGEVAGLAAAICAKKGILPRELDVKKLQSVLKKRGLLDEKHRPKPAISSGKRLQLPASSALSVEKATDLAWLATTDRSKDNALVLKSMLDSGNAVVRFKAAAALAYLGGNGGVRELIKRVTERTPEKIEGARTVPMWQTAIVFLGMARDKSAIPPILDVLNDEKANLDTLVSALRALERIGDDSVIPAIGAFLRRKNLPTERVLQVSMGVSSLKPVVDDARWQIELAAAETILRLGGARDSVARIITPHLEDKRSYVRTYANNLMKALAQSTGIIK